MKKLKVVILSALVMTGLAGCGDKEAEHTHTFAESWTSDSTSHWHASTCGHDVKSGEAPHVDTNHDGKCDVCAFEGLEVKHTDSGNGYCSCGLKISVVKVELDISNAKLVYTLGEALDTTGVKLTATFLDGSTAEIPFTATADLTSVGSKVVTLEYSKEDAEGTKGTISYNVTVSYWSEEDLEVLQYATLFGDYGITFPYIQGAKVDYTLDEDEDLKSWNILKENATESDLQDLYELLNYYEETAIDEDYDIELTYKFAEVAEFDETELAFIESEYGFEEDDFVVFRLAPTYIAKNGPSRAFTADEYFIAGIIDGDLKVFDRFVDAYFEGFWGSTGVVEGQGYDIAKLVAAGYSADDVLADAIAIPYYYGSEFAEICMGMPEFGNDEGYVFFTSYKGVYAFDPYYDDFDMALEVDCINGSKEGYDKFIESLLTLGYVKDAEKERYTLEKEYLGSVTYSFYPYSDTFTDDVFGPGKGEYYGFNGGYAVAIYYTMPDRDDYVTYLTPELDKILKGFGDKVEYLEIIDDYYDSYGELVADFYVVSEGEPLVSSAVLSELVALLPEGFFPVDDPAYNEKNKCWQAEFTDGTYGVYLSVYDADQDGDCEVLLELFEGEEILETFVYKMAKFGEENGFPVQVNPNENAYIISTVVPVEQAAQGGITSLEAAVEYIVGNYVQYSGLVAVPTEEPEISGGAIIVTTKSVDGNYSVTFQFSVQTIEEVEYYVVQIVVEYYTEPWAGTAEEGIELYISSIGLSVEGIKENDGIYSFVDFLVTGSNAFYADAENSVVAQVAEIIASYLPRGCVKASELAKNSSTGLWEVSYTSADGTITFLFTIEWYEVPSMPGACVPYCSIYVFNTPAE